MKIYSLFLLAIFFSILISNVAKKRKKSKTNRRRASSNYEIKTNISGSIFDIPSPDDVISEYGIVFSWHSRPSKIGEMIDPRWQHDTIGSGNEFRVAVLSCKNAHPEIPIYLFTNVPSIDPDIRKNIHRAYQVDLLKESGFEELIRRTGDPKFGFISKAQSLITGWALGVLPEKVVHLDVDVLLVCTSERRDLYSVFEPLKYYDMAGVMEGYSMGSSDPFRPTPAVGQGWEMNTGVLAVRRSSRGIVERWVEVFRDEHALFSDFESGEQQALMLAFERNPQYRWFPLPPVFNFRRSSLFARNGPTSPVLLHSHIYHYEGALVQQYAELGRLAAAIVFEDALHHLARTDGPHHFLCDLIVA